MAPSSFYKLFSALKVEKCKLVIFLCIFGIFLCIIKWLGQPWKLIFIKKFESNIVLETKIQIKINHPSRFMAKGVFWKFLMEHWWNSKMIFFIYFWQVSNIFKTFKTKSGKIWLSRDTNIKWNCCNNLYYSF